MSAARVQVALPVPIQGCFDYLCPGTAMTPTGSRVRVRFGPRQLVGVVMGPAPEREPALKLRAHGEILDEAPILDQDILALARWAANYYQQPIGQVIAACLPSGLRRGGDSDRGHRDAWLRITDGGRAALPTLPARATAQRELLQALSQGPQARAQVRSSALPRSLEQGWVELIPPPQALQDELEAPLPLSAQQQKVVTELLAQTQFGVQLLEGITGSGKTEVYCACISEQLRAGRQVLVLAPEIGLTPQLVSRLQRRYGGVVGQYHSGMGDAERARQWQAARSGKTRVLVGTRSASWLPLPDLGLIVIDEEHDASFKQQDGLRYHARDLAIVRARAADIPVILGSATPALESLQNAGSGRFNHLRLTERANRRPSPAISSIDLRHNKAPEGLSEPLYQRISQHLEDGGQALLFINRRGFAPALLCQGCGWMSPCPNCDARMTLHRGRKQMICHHCARTQPVPEACPECQLKPLVPLGQGTERIEQALRARFAGRRIERLDSDRMQKRGELARLLADTRSGAIDILVGTQILAKGHDFAGLTLVGIVNVDQALFGTDFRALERMGQLVTQVAGRAGRGERAGEVLLQTHQPEHPQLRLLIEQGYAALASELLEQRQQHELPPYSHLALLRAESAQAGASLQFLQDARAALGTSAQLAMGPIPAPMERLNSRSRAQLLLRHRQRPALQKLLADWVPQLQQLPSARRVRWSIDVDPIDLF